jgi:hypothetical protein
VWIQNAGQTLKICKAKLEKGGKMKEDNLCDRLLRSVSNGSGHPDSELSLNYSAEGAYLKHLEYDEHIEFLQRELTRFQHLKTEAEYAPIWDDGEIVSFADLESRRDSP